MGFRIRELMMGYHEYHEGPPGRQPFGFRLTWGPDRLRDWLNPFGERFMWQEAHGEVLIGGLTDWTPCSGTLELQYVSHRRIRYCFDAVVDGVIYRYVGEKLNINPINLPVSHTTCYGTLTELESGRLVSTSLVFFKLRHLPRFAGSLRRA